MVGALQIMDLIVKLMVKDQKSASDITEKSRLMAPPSFFELNNILEKNMTVYISDNYVGKSRF